MLSMLRRKESGAIAERKEKSESRTAKERKRRDQGWKRGRGETRNGKRDEQRRRERRKPESGKRREKSRRWNGEGTQEGGNKKRKIKTQCEGKLADAKEDEHDEEREEEHEPEADAEAGR